MTMTTPQDFIASYNHTLSSTFSHPTLPFIHHSHNWSDCPRTISLPSAAEALALSPDESLLAVAAGSDVLIYNTEGEMNLTYTLKGHMGWVSEVEWYPGTGRKLVSGSSINGNHQEETVRFWDLDCEDSLARFQGVELDCVMMGVAAAARDLQPGMSSDRLSESQRQFSIASKIDLEDVARKATMAAAEALVSQGGWSNDEVSATGLQSLILVALQEAQVKRSILRGFTFPGTLPGFGSSALSPDGSLVFYLPTWTTVAVLSASTRSEMFHLEGHTDGIMWVGASPDGKLLATSSWDRTVKIWDLRDGSLVRTLRGTMGQNWTGSWSPDGKLFAVGSGDQTVRVWDVLSGETVHVLGGKHMFSGWVRGIAFEPSNGSYLVAASWGGTVRVFDMHSGECTNLYQIDPIASSPLGRMAESYMEISTSLKHAAGPSGLFGFKPTDGRLVIYDTERNEMWDLVQDKEGSERIFGSGTFVFAKGRKRVYSADVDGAVRVWDLN